MLVALTLPLWFTATASAAPAQLHYQKYCASCHGDDGDGRGRAGASFQPPATNFRAPANAARLTRDYLIRVIAEGKPGTAMVGYARRLDERERAALADFLLTRFIRSPSSRQGAVSPGRHLYMEHCAVCHGDEGNVAVWARNGLQPLPRDFTRPEAREELSLERMITSVTHGRPGTAMMPFQRRLTSEQIATVVDFIRAEFMGMAGEVSPPLAAMDKKEHEGLGYPAGLVGDVERGRRFYHENCFTCHGHEGDGKGPRAHFNVPAPRNFLSPESRARFGRARLFVAIAEGKRGTVMPAWNKVLSDQQIADVAEYVYRAFIRDEVKKKAP